MGKYRICVWGDSFPRGARDREMGGWVARLRKYFDNQTAKNVWVENVAISGDTTTTLLQRFATEYELRKSQSRSNICIFEIGINDLQAMLDTKQKRVSLDQFQRNLQSLYLAAQSVASIVIFLSLAPIDPSRTVPTIWNSNHAYYQEDVLDYQQTLHSFVQEVGAGYVHVFDLLQVDDLEDGVHPNAQGHEKIYQKVRDFLFDNKFI